MLHAPFQKALMQEGQLLLEKGCVRQILFSEGTYQVEVKPSKNEETLWPFLQLEDTGRVLDHFCTCEQAEKKGECPHLAAAFLKIFGESIEPLHVRFRHSLWNQLMQMAAKRHGYEVESLHQQAGGGFYAQSLSNKKLFAIRAHTKKGEKQLEEILFHRVLETEETSLKFSNLSMEELSLWREGKPSHLLRYELCFWSDLGKWLMFLEEEGAPYEIVCHPAKKVLPKELEIAFREVSVKFYLAEVNWEELIPSLIDKETPFAIYPYQELVFDQMLYDAQQRSFFIDTHHALQTKFPRPEEEAEVRVLGPWLFHPEIGFYAKEVDPLLRQAQLSGKEAELLLMRHAALLQKYLMNVALYVDPVELSYTLHFDAEYNLHIEGYLFKKGDLQEGDSQVFGPWIFVQDRGFYYLKGGSFQEIVQTIPRKRLSIFVSQHKAFLGQYEGFQTHFTHIESYLTYAVDKEMGLSFYEESQPLEGVTGILDLEEWVYIEGRGFYQKTASKVSQVIVPGLKIAREAISSFIKANEDDLEMIEGFFSLKQPVEKSGLEIRLNNAGCITLRPKVFLTKGYSQDKVLFLSDYSYVKGEGFALLPKGGKIPEKYQQETTLTPQQEEFFLTQELPLLKPYVLEMDASLKTPKRLMLKIHKIERLDSRTELTIQLAYHSEYGEIAVQEIKEALKEKKRWIKTKAGLLDLQDLRFSWLREVYQDQFASDGSLGLSSLAWMRLTLVEKWEMPTQEDPEYEKSMQLLQEMQTLQTSDLFDLEGFTSCLRPYQERGIQWLWFLYSYGLSG
ncbi:MAG: hypothetical protein FJZ63_01145, partial [Chlamydiae bacterium]|nr:hypothetical protein [Chlamydiota bacterium]